MDEFYTDPQQILDAVMAGAANGTLAVIELERQNGTKALVLVEREEIEEGTNIFPLAVLFHKSPFEMFKLPEGAALRSSNGSAVDIADLAEGNESMH